MRVVIYLGSRSSCSIANSTAAKRPHASRGASHLPVRAYKFVSPLMWACVLAELRHASGQPSIQHPRSDRDHRSPRTARPACVRSCTCREFPGRYIYILQIYNERAERYITNRSDRTDLGSRICRVAGLRVAVSAVAFRAHTSHTSQLTTSIWYLTKPLCVPTTSYSFSLAGLLWCVFQ